MSAANFVDALHGMGYAKHNFDESSSIEWLLENEQLAALIEWFTDDIKPSNIITSSEVHEYETLLSSKEVLEGQLLEQALRNLSFEEEEEALLSSNRLKEEAEFAEEKLKLAKSRKETLIQKRNKLSLHKTTVTGRISQLSRIQSSVNQDYKIGLENSHADNLQLNTSLEGLCSAVCELCGMYQSSAAGTHSQVAALPQNAVFFSKLDLDSYRKNEENFSQELTSFTKRLFFDGIQEVASEQNGVYEFVDVNNPDALLLRGERQEQQFQNCKELAMMQAFYPKEESHRINTLMEEKSAESSCEFIENMLQSLKAKPLPNDIGELSSLLKESQQVLSALRRDITSLADDQIPSLINDNKTMQATRILTGDYLLKVARQNFFIGNQEKVIAELVVQRARSEFLTMVYEVERHDHRTTKKLLLAINMLLQRLQQQQQLQMKMLSDPAKSSHLQPRSTVDSRDTFVTRLHSLLGGGGDGSRRQLFMPFTELQEHADCLSSHLASARAERDTVSSSNTQHLHKIEDSLSACEQTLYADSSTSSGQPDFCPRPVLDAITQLDTMMQKLEQAVMDIIKDVDNKKKILHSNNLQVLERELFVYFINDPSRLRRALEEATSRLQAKMVP